MSLRCLSLAIRLLLALALCAAFSSAFAFKMEAGEFRIEDTFGNGITSRSFQQPFDVAPVVFILTTNQGGDSSVVRIVNVTTTGFDSVMVEPPGEDGPHADMDVQYFAIEPGVHTLTVDDEVLGSRTITLEAGVLSTSNIIACSSGPSVCTGSFDNHSFASPFVTSPVVLAQLQTFINGITGVPPAPPAPFITASIDNVTNNGFDYVIDRHEVTTGTLTPAEAANEQIGYLAFDANIRAADFRANNAAQALVEMESIRVDEAAPNAADGWSNGCNENINFSKSLPNRLVMASKQTRNENDGGWLRRCNLTSTRFRVQVDEDVDSDNERSKAIRDGVGALVFSRAFFFDSTFVPPVLAQQFKFEANTVTVTPGTPTNVTLQQFYENIPAVFAIVDNSNPEPAAVRINNVTTDPLAGTTSFDLVVVEPGAAGGGGGVSTTPGGPASEVHYIAAEPGTFTLPDGTRIEVGEVPINSLQQNFGGTDSFQAITMTTTFTAPPAVLTQIQGDANNPADPASPWLTVAYDSGSTTTSSFEIALERSEVSSGGAIAQAENVAYFAIDRGLIGDFTDINGNTIFGEAQFTRLAGNSNGGWDDICFSGSFPGIPFINTYTAPPLVVASEMSHFGGDGGWHRRCALSATHVRIAEDEDQFANSERAHTREDTGLVVFSEPFAADLSLIAWYEMEQPVWNAGAPGQVDNTMGTSFNGTPEDNALTELLTPAFTMAPDSTCRYGVFDGTVNGATADGVTVGNQNLGLNDAVTLTAWARWQINPNTGNPRAVIVRNDTAASFNDFQISLNAVNGNNRFQFRVNTDNGIASVRSANGIANGTWYHLAGVYDGSEVRLYVDGVLVDSTAHSGDVVAYDPARVLSIGKSTHSNNSFRAFNGTVDELRIYQRALTEAEIIRVRDFTRPCTIVLHDHYAVSHSNFAVTCQPSPVVIAAHDIGHGLFAPPLGTTTTITALPGDTFALGSMGQAANFSVAGNVATYIFDGIETQIELLLSRGSPGPVTLTVNDSQGRSADPGENDPIQFQDAIILFSSIGNQIAGRPTTVTVTLIDTAGNAACQAATPAPPSIEIAFECDLPATGCSGLTDGEIDGQPVPAFDSGTATPASSIALTFDASSQATFSMQYNHAGRVHLVAEAMAGTPTATLSGNSLPFDVRPFALDLDVTGNPAASTAGGGVFIPAGETFTTSLRPVRWQVGDDGNNDGIADGHEMGDTDPGNNADLSNNATTLNYVTTGLAPDGRAALDAYLHLPALGVNPGLDDNGATPLRLGPFTGSSTVSSSTLFYDDVGIIEIRAAQTGSYLSFNSAETAAIRGHSGHVGRFIPAYFEVSGELDFDLNNGLASQWTCGFTYLGQPFEYLSPPRIQVTARTAEDSVANNYGGSFFKLLSNFTNRQYSDARSGLPAMPSTLSTSGIAAATFSNQTDFDGMFDINLLGETFTFNKGAAPEVAFAADIELTIDAADFVDDDGVCYPAAMTSCNTSGPDTRSDYIKSNISGTELRYGRVALDNAFGSELQPLPLPMRVEYFADIGGGAGAFVVNTDDAPAPAVDQCTELTLSSAVRLIGSGGEVNGDANVALQGTGGTTNLIDALTATTPAPDPEFDQGLSPLTFAPPLPVGNSGFVDIRVDLGVDGFPWLRFDWDNDGSDDDPTARASFGLYPGREEIIYIREPWD